MPLLPKALILFVIGSIAGTINSVAGGGMLLGFPMLVFLGLPAIIANATSTVAMTIGSVASFLSYRKEFANQKRWAWVFTPPSLIGGFLGAFLLLRTGENNFLRIVPYLIFFATILFTFQPIVSRWLQIEAHVAQKSRHAVAAAIFFQFLVSLYGGYFGAGIGILMLAVLNILVPGDIHEINSLKVLLASLINGVAVVYFIAKGSVSWLDAVLLAIGAFVGGYAGPVIARRVGAPVVRGFVSLVGFAIGLYFLVR